MTQENTEEQYELHYTYTSGDTFTDRYDYPSYEGKLDFIFSSLELAAQAADRMWEHYRWQNTYRRGDPPTWLWDTAQFKAYKSGKTSTFWGTPGDSYVNIETQDGPRVFYCHWNGHFEDLETTEIKPLIPPKFPLRRSS